jgi:hypothetical protein
VKNGEIIISSVPTQDQVADGLTKPLSWIAFKKFVSGLGLTTLDREMGISE